MSLLDCKLTFTLGYEIVLCFVCFLLLLSRTHALLYCFVCCIDCSVLAMFAMGVGNYLYLYSSSYLVVFVFFVFVFAFG